MSIRYQCKSPNKKIVSKADLDAEIDTAISDDITSDCQDNGTYSIDISQYTCTKPCPFLTLHDAEVMQYDWTENTTKPEIWQEVR
jgi:hypothetical protein